MAARACSRSGARIPNFGSLYDLFANLFREPWVIQRFLPKITEGDKRIILIDGEAAGAVNRVPAANDIRSNMVRGGAAKPTDLTPREREICETIGPDLKRMGLILVGIDVIDGNLTEINVTAPTGVRAIKRLGGPDLAVTVWDVIESKVRRLDAHPLSSRTSACGRIHNRRSPREAVRRLGLNSSAFMDPGLATPPGMTVVF